MNVQGVAQGKPRDAQETRREDGQGRSEAPSAQAAALPATIVPRGKWVRWNRAMADGFFSHLAGSCNVAASARAIGVTPSQVHHRRRTNAKFAKAWAEAIEAGYQLLETRLLGHALAGGAAVKGDETIASDDPDCVGPVDWNGGVKLLSLYRAQREGRTKTPGPKPTVATRAETDAAILKKLAALAAAKAKREVA